MAGKIQKWSNVRIAMQTALAAAVTVTAITAGTTATVTAEAHGFSNGDYILLTTNGMQEMNNTVHRVSASSTDSFVLEGQDTTGFEAFISGTARKITFGASFGTITQLSSSGGDFGQLDTTTIHVARGSQIPGVANALSYTLESFWDISDAALKECREASIRQEQRAYLFTFASGQKMAFAGYVGYSGAPQGQAQQIITSPLVLTVQGEPIYLES